MCNLRVRLGAIASLALVAAGCVQEPGVIATVLVGDDVVRPDHLTVTWLTGDRTLVEARRVPDSGDLPLTGPLASIFVSLNPLDPSDRKLLIHGVSDGVPS
jgi:hypothetical protein